MLIAKEKEKENIAEYILYMWQMEDLVRGSDINLEKVLQKVFRDTDVADERDKYALWFSQLIEQMNQEGLTKNGHVKGVKTYMKSIESLHHALLTVYQEQKYAELYKNSSPYLKDLRAKSGSSELPETEVCLIGLYGFLMLKMSGSEISSETSNAMREIGQLLAYLANAFNRLRNGELKLPTERNN